MQKYITVKGVKTNNLKNIDVDIPRGKITAIAGVSGAGKTSLAFDTGHQNRPGKRFKIKIPTALDNKMKSRYI